MIFHRRDFLKSIGSASLAGSLLSASDAVAAIRESGDISNAFDFADDKVPMNSANLCPMPSSVSRFISNFQRDLDVDMSGANRERVEAMKERARQQIAPMLGVSADEIAFVRNTSEANNVVVQGLPVGANDEILLWDQNHSSNSVAWQVRAKRSGCRIRYLSVPVDTGSIDEVVSLFTDAIGPHTKVVSFTHISNVTGFRLPAKEICDAIRKKANVHIHIDGAQTWGAVDIDLSDVGCDTFTGSAHKWFMGPREVGLLYVKEQSIGKIWPTIVSVPWGDGADTSAVGARKFEALGQRDDAALAGLVAAASVHETITPALVERRSMRIANRLRAALSDAGVSFVSTLNPLFTSSVVILSARPENGSTIVRNVLRDGGIVTAATGGFRMSPHINNNEDHIDRVVRAVAKSRSLLTPG